MAGVAQCVQRRLSQKVIAKAKYFSIHCSLEASAENESIKLQCLIIVFSETRVISAWNHVQCFRNMTPSASWPSDMYLGPNSEPETKSVWGTRCRVVKLHFVNTHTHTHTHLGYSVVWRFYLSSAGWSNSMPPIRSCSPVCVTVLTWIMIKKS